MRARALVVTLAACGGGGAAIDAAIADPADGHYTCAIDLASGGGGSCDEPWRATYAIDVAGATLTMHLGDSVGLMPTGDVACTGTWTGAVFACAASWTRTGRACTSTFHLRIDSATALTFWKRADDPALGLDRAACAR